MGNTFQWNDRELLRYLGCKNGIVPDENTKVLIAQCKQELEQAASPRVTWREYSLSIQDHVIDMTCFQTRSKSLERNLKDCEQILLFAATLGSQVDVLLHRYNMIQMSKAVVMQAASVAMLETFCDEENQKLKEAYQEKGWYLRPRFSPGYGDFPLECQRQIAPALELSKRIGVTLTDSLLMAPSKSVTAVIGLSRLPRNCTVQGCEVCAKRDCAYRR
ncbi:Vitamin B12 dependent methionine synthase activation subunit [Clostridium sp. OM02-18AC]|uniref:vitamin B12 dependent-methionine synthase activation domain-containing protein n=1 Tax=Clostridium sp. OM02-18AC TaxID=2292311 RepID=UPI000E4AB993|nr:vitamin B12 dependent-methionine synthase activation domain-containing protein [Clostridium sp. OM02-18AC]RHV69732.1 Vitamin B12 dependent methionine synthase activation subunit [Clostridium sp. OM02-18AC]